MYQCKQPLIFKVTSPVRFSFLDGQHVLSPSPVTNARLLQRLTAIWLLWLTVPLIGLPHIMTIGGSNYRSVCIIADCWLWWNIQSMVKYWILGVLTLPCLAGSLQVTWAGVGNRLVFCYALPFESRAIGFSLHINQCSWIFVWNSADFCGLSSIRAWLIDYGNCNVVWNVDGNQCSVSAITFKVG